MLYNKTKNRLFGLLIGLLSVFVFVACSTKKNTLVSRSYHSLNTRYNIYFNAHEAYKEALKAKEAAADDNLSKLLFIYPDNSDTTNITQIGSFTTTIDKCTKAIKLHSIKTKPSRDPKRRDDRPYQAWLKQQEFTPFMDKVWLLLARSELNEGNYLRAITTFMYITKIYSSNAEIVAESKLHIVRAYTEMGWLYEAGDVLYKLEMQGSIPENQQGLYNAVKANYLVRNNDFHAAIPYLELAIKEANNKTERTKMKYLLGQLYAETGNKTKATQAFASVKGLNTPYKYTFNAQLRQLELANSSSAESIKKLNKMVGSIKNKDYKDQLYYTIGNIYLLKGDTAKTIENYRKSIKESTRNGYDKTMSEIALADIYFNQRKYVLAQPNYSGALSQLKKNHADYPRVALRSSVLDELAVHATTIYEQDSLQHLAQLPPDERMKFIEQKIIDLKKEEARKEKEEQLEKQKEQRKDRISSWADLEQESMFGKNPNEMPKIPLKPSFGQQQGNTASFYFYNEQVVSQGKIAFQKQWGNRKLEDDWRRRNKVKTGFNDDDLLAENDEQAEIPKDSIEPDKQESQKKVEQDKYSPEYYLQQLPLTAQAIDESNELIEDALFNMGKIYKDKLEDLDLSIGAFTTDVRRFPQTPNLEEIYYQLFLIYMQKGNGDMMASYRNRIISEFPKSDYTLPLSDPNYEWNFRHIAILQDSLYDASYQAYLAKDVKTVRDNYQNINTKYPFGNLMPKFALLNALSYAQTFDAVALGDNLKTLVEKYPKSDVTPLATDILSHIKEGMVLLSDGSPIRSLDWSNAFVSDTTAAGKAGKLLAYSDSLDTEYTLLLMFKPQTIDKNELLYQVADYNFSNYVVQTFDLNFQSDKVIETLEIKGFKTFANIKSYIDKGFEPNGLFHSLDTAIVVLPISVENYADVYPRLGLENYIAFFKKQYIKELPKMIAYWGSKKIETEIEEAIAEDKTEDAEKTQPEISETVIPKKNDTEIPIKKPVKESDDKRQITGDDLFTEDQLENLGKANDAIETVGNLINNPVDGIKNILKGFSNKNKLTKEEKAEQKEQERADKLRLKELRTAEKAKQDSILKIEKTRQDSINNAERMKIELRVQQETAKKEAIKAVLDAKANARKQKDNERKDKLNKQTELRKQKEKAQKEKQRAQQQLRKEKEKAAKEKQKLREKRK